MHKSEMTRFSFTAFAFLLLLATVVVAQAAPPEAGSTGVGLIIGDPLGPRFKTWLSPTRAIDAGFGLGEDVIFYADYTWNGWDVFPRPERGQFVGYLGLGPRYEARHHRRDTMGLRLPAGLSYFVESLPLELYVELVPVLRVAPNVEGDVDAGLGIHYYFN